MSRIKIILVLVTDWLRRKASFHKYAFIVAIFVACVAGVPQIMVRQTLGSADEGIPYLTNDSDGEYLGRIREVLDGYWSVSSPVLYEYKDSISLMPPTGEFIFYVIPMKLTGLSLESMVFLSRFLYPALIFFFAYLFILSLLNKSDRGARFSAISGALLIAIGYSASDLRGIVSYFTSETTSAFDLVWNRLVHPITGGVLLFAYLWLLSRTVNERGKWLMVSISGLVLAAMSGYIFSFAVSLSVTALIGLYFVWRKNLGMVFRTYIPVVIALLLNATYFAGVFMAMRGAEPMSDPLKSGLFITHVPMINMISYAALAAAMLCFILFFRKDTGTEKEKRWWFIALAAAVTGVLVYVQQAFTGRTVAPQHFVYYTKPLAMAIGAVFLHNIVRTRAKHVWRVAVVLISLVSIFYGWRFISTVQLSVPQYADMQSFSGVFDYLNTNAEKDCVVYVSSDYKNEINRFITAFTGCNVYYSYYIYNGVPAERVMHNFLVNLRLLGIKPKDVEKHFYDNRRFIQGYFFRDWGDMFCCDRWLEHVENRGEIELWYASVEKDVEKKYAEYLKGSLYSQLTQYRLDYFVVDTDVQPQVNEKNYKFLSPEGKFGRFLVYSIIEPK